MVKRTLVIVLLWVTMLGYAQKTSEIKLIAKSFGDSIALRWSANTPLSWKLCNQYGYRLMRYVVSRNNNLLPDRTKGEVVEEIIKPKEVQAWHALIEENDKALIAAQAIFGESFEISTGNTGLMTMINQARELESRFSFALLAIDQDFQVAQLSGLGYVDRDVDFEEDYVYEVIPLVPDSVMQISSGSYFVQTKMLFDIPAPKLLSVNSGDRVAELKWGNVHYEKHFTSWIIERSLDGGKSFSRVNVNGFVQLQKDGGNQYHYYLDSLPQNHVVYTYRIKGITPFGELSPPSDTLKVIGKPTLNVSPVLQRPEIWKNGMVALTWEFPKELDSLLMGFQLLKSTNHKAGFEEAKGMLSNEKRFVVDSIPFPITYYKIQAYTFYGDVLNSQVMAAQLKDSTPPLPPNDIQIIVDTTGLVQISWLANNEEDLDGYRIFRANALHEEFIQVTKEVVRDTFFLDRIDLKNLSTKIYYKIIAQDLHFNKSDFSETVGVIKPNIIPPVPPVIKKIKNSGNSIELYWVNSPSKGVKENWLLRKEVKSKKWVKVFSAKKSTHYTDKGLEPGKTYEYTMYAVDSSGLSSEKSPYVQIQSKKIERVEKPVFNAKLDADKKVIILSWERSASAPEHVIVYRSINDEQIRSYTTITGEKLRLIDEDLFLGSKYGYRIQFTYSDGTRSPFSEVVEVRF